MQTFYSHGKLLLTGEYLVLDGATALAIPTKKGQILTIKRTTEPLLKWQSVLADNTLWFETTFALPLNKTVNNSDSIIKQLHKILIAAQTLNPDFLSESRGYGAQSILEFHRDWGLGSSSTLIANIAQWAGVDPYKLLEMTFRGSGYDIACAKAKTPITYSLRNKKPHSQEVIFNPAFTDRLFFVHLNRKQNSRESIAHYNDVPKEQLPNAISTISKLTEEIITCTSFERFEELLNTHEQVLSNLLQTKTVKELRFPDYSRVLKSLGGWGGDFILATGTEETMGYFINKGYTTIIPYQDMAL